MPTNLNEKLRPEQLPVGWPWKFFLFSLLVIITALVIYLGLAFGYQPFLVGQINEADQSLVELSQTIPVEQQENLIKFYSQVVNLQSLLTNHVGASKIFAFLQRNTNKLVFYTAMDLRVTERRLNLEGVAADYDVFSQQLEAFSSAAEVENLVVSESNAINGRVKFKLYLILQNEIFH